MSSILKTSENKIYAAVFFGIINLIGTIFVAWQLIDGIGRCHGTISDECGGIIIWVMVFFILPITLINLLIINSLSKESKKYPDSFGNGGLTKSVKVLKYFAIFTGLSPLIGLFLLIIVASL